MKIHCRIQPFCVLLAFLLTFVSLLQAAEHPIRLAVVSDPFFANAEAALTVVLSKDVNLHLLERKELDQVLKEQSLQLSGASLSDSIKAGKLLAADGLILIRPAKKDSPDTAVVTLLSVETGVILRSELMTTKELVESIPRMLGTELPRLALSPGQAIPLSIIPAEAASSTALEAQQLFQTSLILRLSKEPGLFILERQRMEPILDEQFLDEQKRNKLWGGARILEVQIGQDTMRPGTWLAVFQLKERSGKTLDKWQVEGAEVSALIEPASGQILQRLKIGKSSVVWDAKEEIKVFRKQFDKLMGKNFGTGIYYPALSELAVTLYTLGERNPLVWQYYAMHTLKDADQPPLFKLSSAEWAQRQDKSETLIRLAKAATISLQQECNRIEQLTHEKRELTWETSELDWLRQETILFLNAAEENGLSVNESPFKESRKELQHLAATAEKAGVFFGTYFLPDAVNWGLSPEELIEYYRSTLEKANYKTDHNYDVRNISNWFAMQTPLWWREAFAPKDADVFDQRMFQDLENWCKTASPPVRIVACYLLFDHYIDRVDKPSVRKVLVDTLETLNPGFASGEYSPELRTLGMGKLGSETKETHYPVLLKLSLELLSQATTARQAGVYVLPNNEADARQLYEALQAASSRLGENIEKKSQELILQKFPQIQGGEKAAVPTVDFKLLWSGNNHKAFGIPDGQEFASDLASHPITENGKVLLVIRHTGRPGTSGKSYSLVTIDLKTGQKSVEALPLGDPQMQPSDKHLIYLNADTIHIGPFGKNLLEGWLALDRKTRRWSWFAFPVEHYQGTCGIKLVGRRLFRPLSKDFPQKALGIQEIGVMEKIVQFHAWPDYHEADVSLFSDIPMEADVTGKLFILGVHKMKSHDPLHVAFDRTSNTWMLPDVQKEQQLLAARAGELFAQTGIGSASNSTSYFGSNLQSWIKHIPNTPMLAWDLVGFDPVTKRAVEIHGDFSKSYARLVPKKVELLARLSGNEGWLHTYSLAEGVLIGVKTPWEDNYPDVFFAPWATIPTVASESPVRFWVETSQGIAEANSQLRPQRVVLPAKPTGRNQLESRGESCLAYFSPLQKWMTGKKTDVLEKWSAVPAAPKDVVHLGQDGKKVWILTQSGQLQTFSISDIRLETILDLAQDKPLSFALSPDGQRMVLGSQSALILLNVATKEISREKFAKPFAATEVSWSSDGTQLMAGDGWKHCELYQWTGQRMLLEKNLEKASEFKWLSDSKSWLFLKELNEKQRQICLGSLNNPDERVLVDNLAGAEMELDAKNSRFFTFVRFNTASEISLLEYDLKTFSSRPLDQKITSIRALK